MHPSGTSASPNAVPDGQTMIVGVRGGAAEGDFFEGGFARVGAGWAVRSDWEDT